jgi:hypothetical protein
MTVSLFDAMNNGTRTTNGMPAFKSTNSALLDFFSKVGDARGVDITPYFNKAFVENQEIAVRTLLWARDVRGGAGERKTFRDLLGKLARTTDFKNMQGVIKLTPEVGRWDDLFVLLGTSYDSQVKALIKSALDAGNGLCAKWMPRQGTIAADLRTALGMTPKQWRKTLVNLTKVVETQMCAKDWTAVEYSKVPSKAIGKYAKAFGRNDGARFTEFKQKVEKGEAKINAGAVYPYDVVNLLRRDTSLAEIQWKALPDYVQGSTERAICVVDVSGSMDSSVGGVSMRGVGTTCMDVAISLGIYTAERLEGVFKNTFITFTDNPKIVKFKEGMTLRDRVAECKRDVGYSTNLEGVFDAVLNAAVANKVPQEQMPTKIIMISDMQFNQQVRGDLAVVPMIQEKYKQAGYEMPSLVFWNVGAAKFGNSPFTIAQEKVCMVSGFSPSILTSILSGKDGAMEVMLDAVGKARYNYLAVQDVAEVAEKPKRKYVRKVKEVV